MEIGTRVGAILSANETEVRVLGFGVYEGEHIPSADSAGIGKMLHEASMKNPRILLDSGSYVYGCECWWGSEESVKKKIADRTVINEDINKIRKEQVAEEQ